MGAALDVRVYSRDVTKAVIGVANADGIEQMARTLQYQRADGVRVAQRPRTTQRSHGCEG